MYLAPEEKAKIFAKHGKDSNDTGSTEGQIALFTYRIEHLTKHLKANHKDYATIGITIPQTRKQKQFI